MYSPRVAKASKPAETASTIAPTRGRSSPSPSAGAWSRAVEPAVVQDALRSPGQPLDASTRASMASRFGYDFTNVRVHADAGGEAAADAVNARAFAYGRHVVFGRNQYAPRGEAGARLLAHELAHVVQQARGGDARSVQSPSSLENSAERAAEAFAAGNGPVTVAGAAPSSIARAPPQPAANPPRNFEGAAMITVELPLDAQSAGRLGYEKDFHGFLPASVEEDDARWHASHAVGPIVGAEREEGILLAPRGVNLSLQKCLENEINRIKQSVPAGGKLILKVETGAHPGTRRLSFINYEARVVGSGGQTTALTATVRVSNDLERPVADISVGEGGPSGNEAARRYQFAFDISKRAAAITDADRAEPLRPRSSKPATYSSTATATKRHEVPGPEVSERRPKAAPADSTTPSPPAAATETSGAATVKTAASPDLASDAAKPKPAPASKPADVEATAAPGSAGRPAPARGQTTADVGEKELPPAEASRPPQAEAIAGGIAIANEYIRKGLEQASAGEAMGQAWNDYYARKQEIVEELWTHPGSGMIVLFSFEHVPAPNENMAAQVKYLGMTEQLAGSEHERVAPGLYQLTEKATPFHWPIWIPPVRHARAAAAKESTKEAPPKAPVFIRSAEEFVRNSVGSTPGLLNYELDAYEALQAAKPVLPGGYEVSIRGRALLVEAGIYGDLTHSFEKLLRDKLAARADRLEADIHEAEQRLGKYLSEGLVKRALISAWEGGRDIDLDPHMFDRPKAHLSSARIGISRNVFRDPLNSLRLGEALVESARDTLYRYATGITAP